jgi:hypothetical protein
VTFHNAAGTSANVQRSSPSPQQERKESLKRFQEIGFKEGRSGVYRYTDSGVLAVAGKDALTMIRRGRRLGKEARERNGR